MYAREILGHAHLLKTIPIFIAIRIALAGHSNNMTTKFFVVRVYFGYERERGREDERD